jgi:phosphomannomutase
MNSPFHIFRAYDVRGIAMGDNPEITSGLARRIAHAFVTELKIKNPKLAVGRDD